MSGIGDGKNSGNASGGGWTLTGTAGSKQKLAAMRKEYTGPRTGDLAHRASKRPGKK